MRIAERIIDGDARLGFIRIRSGKYDLLVESRELYTAYKIVRTFGGYYYNSWKPILYHSVRTPDPVPIRPAHIIHARNIPWFMWIYYLVRDAIEKRRWARHLKAAGEKERIRINAIRALADRHMSSRFKGRYN
jgi:hypothetical protein